MIWRCWLCFFNVIWGALMCVFFLFCVDVSFLTLLKKLFMFASLFKLCWQKKAGRALFILRLSSQVQAQWYGFEYLLYMVCVCEYLQYLNQCTYYFSKDKCFVFYIVLERANATSHAVCDVICIKMCESHLVPELTGLLSWSSACFHHLYSSRGLWRKWCILYTFRKCFLKIKKKRKKKITNYRHVLFI